MLLFFLEIDMWRYDLSQVHVAKLIYRVIYQSLSTCIYAADFPVSEKNRHAESACALAAVLH